MTIGKRISNRIFLTYARSLSSSQRDQIILLEFDESDIAVVGAVAERRPHLRARSPKEARVLMRCAPALIAWLAADGALLAARPASGAAVSRPDDHRCAGRNRRRAAHRSRPCSSSSRRGSASRCRCATCARPSITWSGLGRFEDVRVFATAADQGVIVALAADAGAAHRQDHRSTGNAGLSQTDDSRRTDRPVRRAAVERAASPRWSRGCRRSMRPRLSPARVDPAEDRRRRGAAGACRSWS